MPQFRASGVAPQFAAPLRLSVLSRIEPLNPSDALSCGGHNLLWHVLRYRFLFLRPLNMRQDRDHPEQSPQRLSRKGDRLLAA